MARPSTGLSRSLPLAGWRSVRWLVGGGAAEVGGLGATGQRETGTPLANGPAPPPGIGKRRQAQTKLIVNSQPYAYARVAQAECDPEGKISS
jgi:hypothetical protein